MNDRKLILGGAISVVSAFGITIAVYFALAALDRHNGKKAMGLGTVAGSLAPVLHNGWLWLAVFLVFATGLFLAYRKL